MNQRIVATIATLWVAAVVGITVWFATHDMPVRGPIDPNEPNRFKLIFDQERGYSTHDGFGTTTWLVWVGIVTAVAVVALVLANVWSSED